VKPARAARLLFQLPRGCRVFSAIQPANQWGWMEILLNKANYLLEVLVWQNANEGVKRSKQSQKPQPFIPDFLKDRTMSKDAAKLDATEIAEILKKPRTE
jgi:hypothetical protein